MSAYQAKILYPATVIATDTTTTSASGSVLQLPCHSQELIFESVVASRTDGTYTTTVQHSPDNSNWYTLVAGTAQSTNTRQILTVASTVTHFMYIRASILSSSTTSGATVSVNAFYGEQRM